MSELKTSLIKIYQTERGIIIMILINILLALILFVFSTLSLNPNAAVVKIGYGDIGGYRDGTWVNMICYPILALVFGILHSILAIRIFRKRGDGMAKLFLAITTILILGTFLVLTRLLSEG